MNIMVFGGSFDPPHNGHTQIVQYVLSNKLCDEVWFVPCGSHPFDKKFSDAEHRVNMLKLVALKQTKISSYEVEKEGKSFTFETLSHFSTSYPNHHFSFLMGSDQLPSFHKWNNYEQLAKTFKICVYPRKGYPFDPLYPNMTALTNAPVIPISSTDVRSLIKNHEDYSNFVSKEVLEYINANGLYNT